MIAFQFKEPFVRFHVCGGATWNLKGSEEAPVVFFFCFFFFLFFFFFPVGLLLLLCRGVNR